MPNFNGGLIRPPLKLEHGSVITTPRKLRPYLFIHGQIVNLLENEVQVSWICILMPQAHWVVISWTETIGLRQHHGWLLFFASYIKISVLTMKCNLTLINLKREWSNIGRLPVITYKNKKQTITKQGCDSFHKQCAYICIHTYICKYTHIYTKDDSNATLIIVSIFCSYHYLNQCWRVWI